MRTKKTFGREKQQNQKKKNPPLNAHNLQAPPFFFGPSTYPAQSNMPIYLETHNHERRQNYILEQSSKENGGQSEVGFLLEEDSEEQVVKRGQVHQGIEIEQILRSYLQILKKNKKDEKESLEIQMQQKRKFLIMKNSKNNPPQILYIKEPILCPPKFQDKLYGNYIIQFYVQYVDFSDFSFIYSEQDSMQVRSLDPYKDESPASIAAFITQHISTPKQSIIDLYEIYEPDAHISIKTTCIIERKVLEGFQVSFIASRKTKIERPIVRYKNFDMSWGKDCKIDWRLLKKQTKIEEGRIKIGRKLLNGIRIQYGSGNQQVNNLKELKSCFFEIFSSICQQNIESIFYDPSTKIGLIYLKDV